MLKRKFNKLVNKVEYGVINLKNSLYTKIEWKLRFDRSQ